MTEPQSDMDSSLSDVELYQLLQDQSTQIYDIEYNGFFTNHMSHGIIALNELGASKQRILSFVDEYKKNLEPADAQIISLTEDKLVEIKGKRTNFSSLVRHYEDLLHGKFRNDLKEMVEHEFLKMVEGLPAAAFHGLIQIGYGVKVLHPRVICEGLAYTFHSYLPFQFGKSKFASRSEKTFFRDTLAVIRNDTKLLQDISEKATKISDPSLSDFEKRMHVLMAEHADYFHMLTSNMEFPKTLDVCEVAEWLHDQAVWLYANSERRNDFFLLHGVTATWGLMQVIGIVPNPDIFLHACEILACALLVTYAAQQSPKILPTDAWNNVHMQGMDELIKDALNKDFDEHIYKILQVVQDRMSKRDCTALCAQMCMRAAYTAVNFDLMFD